MRPKAPRTSGRKIQATSCPPGSPPDGLEQRNAEDHRADKLGGRRFEDVRATAGAIANVVADEIGDDGWIAGIVLGNTGLDLADKVGADVGSLGVDTAAELGEERDEACAEGESDDPVGRFGNLRGGGVRTLGELVDDRKDAADAEKRQSDDQEARDRSTAKGDDQGFAEVLPGTGGRAQIAADGDIHPDETGESRQNRTDEKRDAGNDAAFGFVILLEEGNEHTDHDCDDDRE